MEATNIKPAEEPPVSVLDRRVAPPMDIHTKRWAGMRRRGLWLIGILLVLAAGVVGYHWAFGKAKVLYATIVVERGNVESTVLAAV